MSPRWGFKHKNGNIVISLKIQFHNFSLRRNFDISIDSVIFKPTFLAPKGRHYGSERAKVFFLAP
jgi:hypothetical protein